MAQFRRILRVGSGLLLLYAYNYLIIIVVVSVFVWVRACACVSVCTPVSSNYLQISSAIESQQGSPRGCHGNGDNDAMR